MSDEELDESLILRVPADATEAEIIAIARAQFTAADLEKYAEDDDVLIPAEEVLADLERIHADVLREMGPGPKSP